MSPRVLLIEDDPLSLKLMRDVLEANGFETYSSGNGLDAQASAESLRPQVIVMDIGLPGLDGEEATKRLKQSPVTGSIPVIAVSAYAMPSDESRMRSAGCSAFLAKPLRFKQFVEVVRLLVASSQANLTQAPWASGSEK